MPLFILIMGKVVHYLFRGCTGGIMKRELMLISSVCVLLLITGCGTEPTKPNKEGLEQSLSSLGKEQATKPLEAKEVQDNPITVGDLNPQQNDNIFGEETPLLAQATNQSTNTKSNTESNEREQTLALIREKEDFRSKPYWDVNAWRVGYGQDTINGQRVTPGMRVSREQAEQALSGRYFGKERPAIIRQVGSQQFDQLEPNQRAVLGSLQWNYGHVPPRVVRAVQSGNCMATASAIQSLRTHDRGINASRRDDEARIYRQAC